MAKKLADPALKEKYELISSANLHKGDFVLVEAGEMIPGDGEVVEGAALVNEASVTGESAPVVTGIRRRPKRCNRRYKRHFQPDHHAYNSESGGGIPGQDDQYGRRCKAP